jgi:hypothetical protein
VTVTRTACLSALAVACLVGRPLAAAEPQLDGPQHIFRDNLLDHLVGEWKVTRKMRGRMSDSTARVEWILNHQFLQVHVKGVEKPPAGYEALVLIGYNHGRMRYVAHWNDIFGGKWSETLGFGNRTGNAIRFVFDYPDGPFLNTFTWDPDTKTWTSLMQSKDKAGSWTIFAEERWQRAK